MGSYGKTDVMDFGLIYRRCSLQHFENPANLSLVHIGVEIDVDKKSPSLRICVFVDALSL